MCVCVCVCVCLCVQVVAIGCCPDTVQVPFIQVLPLCRMRYVMCPQPQASMRSEGTIQLAETLYSTPPNANEVTWLSCHCT